MCETLIINCTACKTDIQTFETSKKVGNSQMIDINLRSVMAAKSIGGGITILRRLCTDFNFPQPVLEHPFNNYLKHLVKVSVENEEKSTSNAEKQLRQAMIGGNDDGQSLLDVAFSVDGSWQKRHGFNSLLGMVFAISVETGQVLDYSVKCKFCHECKKKPNATQAWEDSHAVTCHINHDGSSGAMEKEGAIEIFPHSIDKHKLRYSTYVGDGDSSSFGNVKDAVFEKYGDSYTIVKEDCISHIQKRMGSALRAYKNKKRGTKLTDGKGTGGQGRLTDAACDKIQTYYGYAIRNNKGDIDKITNAIWAIYYHSIIGPPEETLVEQHKYCPITDNTWCKYQKDILNNTANYNSLRCLPFIFRGELRFIFERLSSNELLLSCQKGLTQNPNESINGVVWSRCPKRLFCGRQRYTMSVCDAIAQFNEGAKGRKRLYKQLNLDTSYNAFQGLQKQDQVRLRQAAVKISEKYKCRRQALRVEQKGSKSKKDKSYIPGAFTNKSTPDVDFSIEVVEESVKKITFVHDNDVPLCIMGNDFQ